MRKFIHEAAGTSKGDADEDSFVPGDGDDLNDRIHFLPWERNPFDHQQRNHDFCNVMLDSYPYNGHTVAQDSLYGGVPIVTRSDGDDMSSRVSYCTWLCLCLTFSTFVFSFYMVMFPFSVEGFNKCQYCIRLVAGLERLRGTQALRGSGD